MLSDPISFRSKGRVPLGDASSRKELSSCPEIGKRSTGVSAILGEMKMQNDVSEVCVALSSIGPVQLLDSDETGPGDERGRSFTNAFSRILLSAWQCRCEGHL